MLHTIISILGWIALAINIFALFKIYKADILKKILRSLFPLLLNFPAIAVNEMENISFKFFHFQLFGFGSTIWEGVQYYVITIPFGALWVFYKLEDWVREKEMKEY